jgi:hypothetical protein
MAKLNEMFLQRFVAPEEVPDGVWIYLSLWNKNYWKWPYKETVDSTDFLRQCYEHNFCIQVDHFSTTHLSDILIAFKFCQTMKMQCK